MNPNGLEVPVQLRLAALWASTMFMYAYVDIHSLYKPGTVRDILRGRVWDFEVTQGWALGALALMTIPSVMIALSVLLPTTKANQRTNIVVASLFVLVSIGNAIGEIVSIDPLPASLFLRLKIVAWSGTSGSGWLAFCLSTCSARNSATSCRSRAG